MRGRGWFGGVEGGGVGPLAGTWSWFVGGSAGGMRWSVEFGWGLGDWGGDEGECAFGRGWCGQDWWGGCVAWITGAMDVERWWSWCGRWKWFGQSAWLAVGFWLRSQLLGIAQCAWVLCSEGIGPLGS